MKLLFQSAQAPIVCQVSNNTAEIENGCGGVFNNNGKVELSGDSNINGNTAGGQPNNLYIYQRSKIKIAGPMTNLTPIGITTDRTGIFTRGNTDIMKASDYADKFSSDNSEYVIRTAGKDLLLGKPVTYSVSYDPEKIKFKDESVIYNIDNVALDLEIICLDEEEVPEEDQIVSDTYRSDNNLKLGQYYDISLWLQRTDALPLGVSVINGQEINITLDVPENLRNAPNGYRRVFIVFRIHDNKAEKVAESDALNVSFNNSEFSTFVLACQDIKISEAAENVENIDKTEKIERTYAIPVTGID